MKTVIFSHGFGGNKEDIGVFSEIADALSYYKVIRFDYNKVFDNGDIEISTLEEQVKKLQEVINEQSGDVYLIAHSQGCLTASLVDLSKISKVILLAPSDSRNEKLIIAKIVERSGGIYNKNGTTIWHRKNGTTTYIPKAHVDSLGDVIPMDLYQKIADSKPTMIIRATEDDVVGLTKVNMIKNARHEDIASSHNFMSNNGIDKLIFYIRDFFETSKHLS